MGVDGEAYPHFGAGQACELSDSGDGRLLQKNPGTECGNGLILLYKDIFSYQMIFIFIVDKEGE